MQAFEFLLTDHCSAAGHVQRTEHYIALSAQGLEPGSSYDIYLFLPDMSLTTKQKETADKAGALKCRILTDIAMKCAVLIAVQNRCILRSQDVGKDVCRVFLWHVIAESQGSNNASENNAPQKRILSQQSFDENEAEQVKVKTQTEASVLRSKPAVDPLPERVWKSKTIHGLFVRPDAQSVPMTIDLTPWRFIRARASTQTGNKTLECLLGRLFLQHELRASALLIQEGEIASGKTLPGFQYQKAPDGRGFWIKITEY